MLFSKYTCMIGAGLAIFSSATKITLISDIDRCIVVASDSGLAKDEKALCVCDNLGTQLLNAWKGDPINPCKQGTVSEVNIHGESTLFYAQFDPSDTASPNANPSFAGKLSWPADTQEVHFILSSSCLVAPNSPNADADHDNVLTIDGIAQCLNTAPPTLKVRNPYHINPTKAESKQSSLSSPQTKNLPETVHSPPIPNDILTNQKGSNTSSRFPATYPEPTGLSEEEEARGSTDEGVFSSEVLSKRRRFFTA